MFLLILCWKSSHFRDPVFHKNQLKMGFRKGPIFWTIFIDFWGPVWGAIFNINQHKYDFKKVYDRLQDGFYLEVVPEAVPGPILMVFPIEFWRILGLILTFFAYVLDLLRARKQSKQAKQASKTKQSKAKHSKAKKGKSKNAKKDKLRNSMLRNEKAKCTFS